MKRLLILLFLFASLALAKGPVYIVLWFDTEDYIDPAADDAALRIASDLTRLGVSATFKVTGEKARVLESRGRTDVIRALSHHAIGYHTNWHSVQPTEAVYLRRMGAIEGAEEFARREGPGLVDLKRVFGIQPICFGQPGSSWGPQAYPALRRLGVPVYLDEGEQVGLNDQPYWYGGLLSVYNMRRNLIRPDLTNQEKNVEINKAFAAAVENLSNNGGGVISTYFHPTEFVNAEFWDAANFKDGASRERAAWVRPRPRTKEDAEKAFSTLVRYVEMAKKMPDVHFVTARDLLQLYRSPDAPVLDKKTIAEFLSKRITFLSNDAGDLSAADLLIQLLDLPPQTVDGPVSRGQTTYGKAEIPGWLFEKAKSDAADYIRVHNRLPSEVFLGSETLSLADFTATAAQHVLTGGGTVRVARGHLEFERYFSNDPRGAFKWVIHPPDFAAPELLELARLQGWTLKPATLR